MDFWGNLVKNAYQFVEDRASDVLDQVAMAGAFVGSGVYNAGLAVADVLSDGQFQNDPNTAYISIPDALNAGQNFSTDLGYGIEHALTGVEFTSGNLAQEDAPPPPPPPPPPYNPNANAPDADHTFDPAIGDQLTGVVDNMEFTNNTQAQGNGPQLGGTPNYTPGGYDPQGANEPTLLPPTDVPKDTPGIGADNGKVDINGNPVVLPEDTTNNQTLDDAIYSLIPGGADVKAPSKNIAGGSEVKATEKEKKVTTADGIDWTGFALDAGATAADIVGAWMQNAETQADVTSQLGDTVTDLDTKATQATEDYATTAGDIQDDYTDKTGSLTEEERLAKEKIDREAKTLTEDVSGDIADVTSEEARADSNAAGSLSGLEGGTAEALRAEATRLHKQAKADLETKKTRISEDATYNKGVISGKVLETITSLGTAKTRGLRDAETAKNRVVDYTKTLKDRATTEAGKLKDRSTTNAVVGSLLSLLQLGNTAYSKKGYKK